MVAGVAKAYPQLTFEYIIYEMSYSNLILYSSVIPGNDNGGESDEVIKADDPKNREKVKQLLFG